MDMQITTVMDGLEAARRIPCPPGLNCPAPHAHHRHDGQCHEGDRERCLDTGMDDYLTKPISAEDLFDKVDRWTTPPPIEGQATLPQEIQPRRPACTSPADSGSPLDLAQELR